MPRWRPRDIVVALEGAPPSAPGAPLPTVLADEWRTHVLYLAHDPGADRRRSTAEREVDVHTLGTVTVATFTEVWAMYFGATDDAALHGVPLARGELGPHGAYVVQSSSWKAELSARTGVYERKQTSDLEQLTHFALAFHDSTFECVARGVEFESIHGSVVEVTAKVATRLGR